MSNPLSILCHLLIINEMPYISHLFGITMNKKMKYKIKLLSISVLTAMSFLSHAGQPQNIKNAVDKNIQALMKQHQIPGMAVAITYEGKHYFYNYGLANVEKKTPVTKETLFELGSISKTFAATLGGYAQHNGKLNLQSTAADYLPELKSSTIGSTKIIQLATYTAGGLPLQFPAEVTDHDSMMKYYQSWQAKFPAGQQRQYSNPSIGLYGHIAAVSMNKDYSSLMENTILPELGMLNTYIEVPSNQESNYAFGYNKNNQPVRVNPGMLDAEAYGIKSSSTDMIRYIDANLGLIPLNSTMQNALESTHIGYFDTPTFTQAIGWEMYQYPATLPTLLEGNSADMILNPKHVSITHSQNNHINSWVNKTGSTGGFGAYVAYIPSENIGIVLLANKNYPNGERVTAAYNIFQSIVSSSN